MQSLQKLRAALFALLASAAFMLPTDGALAQTVTTLPAYVNPGTNYDFGNGPVELKIVQGNAVFTTSQGYGVVSSISGTLITLTATPTTIPCVDPIVAKTAGNCIIAGGTLTSGTLVGSYGQGGGNIIGVTNVQSAQLPAGTVVGWGAACPASLSGAAVNVQASVGGDFPFNTQARVCGYSPANSGPGAAVLPFTIGAH